MAHQKIEYRGALIGLNEQATGPFVELKTPDKERKKLALSNTDF